MGASARAGRNFAQALARATQIFKKAGIERPRLEAEVLLSFATGLTRAQVLARPEQPLLGEAEDTFWKMVEERAKGYPLQYLTGQQEFMGLTFKVTPQVLIPRRDTEVLVETMLDRVERDKPWVAADVGTGSGAIAVSLAYYLPQAFLYALDISPEALEVARENAKRAGVADRIFFLVGDLLEPLLAGRHARKERLDAVVANLPYIPTEELKQLPREVGYEPRLALDGGKNGLKVIARLLPQAAALLKPGGWLALEIGWDQGERVKGLVRATGAFTEGEIIQDYGGRPRCFLARRVESLARGINSLRST
ncbi:[protein release factor]-glutamine N5-methyltransferase [Thermanaeromonas toyohensis ToBE]|uniref:Release factor glutamine methyltransferase n=1 Tax=Thermanaeromonas toyohensis ToBE TaxID=698762 RepID=A0A1W1W4W2_9FIRM|nr:peptide chain release factor N(5)-glutamine methyltransferase [Thermanaeromonas toyohensis]SMC00114.1 [protein release factor]-glutamine N5-methyltransferase [Thermanaeromonas toyohensis ToBE]